MTQDEIIRMARNAGLDHYLTVRDFAKQLESFTAIVAAHEREACAKLVEEMIASVMIKPMPLRDIVAAIRARSEK